MHRQHAGVVGGRATASGTGRLSQAAAEAWIPRTCFKHGPPGRIGVEVELLIHPDASAHRSADGSGFAALRDAALAGDLAGTLTGQVSVEPGGQLELSSVPADDLPTVLAQTRRDLAILRELAGGHRAELVGAGYDPRAVPERVLAHPRYEAMEQYLDRWGPAGRAMMRSTASLQVNVEAAAEPTGSRPPARARPDPAPAHHPDGDPGDPFAARWDLLHTVGPVLVAAFASSPGRSGPWAGWASARQAIWLSLDPARTAEPRRLPGESVPRAWVRWCLDAPLMMVRREHGPWTAPPGVRFRDWIQAGRSAVPDRPPPTVDDLRYHLTTLFPPVRARGHLEVRYLDTQPGDWWPAPVSVLAALLTDPWAARQALTACAGQRHRWWEAARHGLRDDALAHAAVGVLTAAADSLRAGAAEAADVVQAYLGHWTRRGRCPGDDLAAGRPLPLAPVIGDPARTGSVDDQRKELTW